MEEFEITSEQISEIKRLVHEESSQDIISFFKDFHHADIVKIFKSLENSESVYIFNLLEKERASEVLTRIGNELKENILEMLSSEKIADLLEELDTDDAADILSQVSPELKLEIIPKIKDVDHASHIIELLRYDDDTGGGLMAKEFLKVREDWTVLSCIEEMKEKASEYEKINAIYVVDEQERLVGEVSISKLLVTPTNASIKNKYKTDIQFVSVYDDAEKIVQTMKKYDLDVIPVVNEFKKLVGIITIDDIVDFIEEKAEKDFSLAAGISHSVESNDSILWMIRARLPWLIIGVFGGLGGASIINHFQERMGEYMTLLIFTPLIQATAGNVGVQSSAIVVQGLAKEVQYNSILGKIFKEIFIGFSNAIALTAIVLITAYMFFNLPSMIILTVGVSLTIIIVMAAIVGMIVPLGLNRLGVDPAVATGPFITTSNDIFGILIYFMIAKMILGF